MGLAQRLRALRDEDTRSQSTIDNLRRLTLIVLERFRETEQLPDWEPVGSQGSGVARMRLQQVLRQMGCVFPFAGHVDPTPGMELFDRTELPDRLEAVTDIAERLPTPINRIVEPDPSCDSCGHQYEPHLPVLCGCSGPCALAIIKLHLNYSEEYNQFRADAIEVGSGKVRPKKSIICDHCTGLMAEINNMREELPQTVVTSWERERWSDSGGQDGQPSAKTLRLRKRTTCAVSLTTDSSAEGGPGLCQHCLSERHLFLLTNRSTATPYVHQDELGRVDINAKQAMLRVNRLVTLLDSVQEGANHISKLNELVAPLHDTFGPVPFGNLTVMLRHVGMGWNGTSAMAGNSLDDYALRERYGVSLLAGSTFFETGNYRHEDPKVRDAPHDLIISTIGAWINAWSAYACALLCEGTQLAAVHKHDHSVFYGAGIKGLKRSKLVDNFPPLEKFGAPLEPDADARIVGVEAREWVPGDEGEPTETYPMSEGGRYFYRVVYAEESSDSGYNCLIGHDHPALANGQQLLGRFNEVHTVGSMAGNKPEHVSSYGVVLAAEEEDSRNKAEQVRKDNLVAAGRLAADDTAATATPSVPESSEDEADGSPVEVVRIIKTPTESLMTGNVLRPTRQEIVKAFKREQFTGIPVDAVRYPTLQGVTALVIGTPSGNHWAVAGEDWRLPEGGQSEPLKRKSLARTCNSDWFVSLTATDNCVYELSTTSETRKFTHIEDGTAPKYAWIQPPDKAKHAIVAPRPGDEADESERPQESPGAGEQPPTAGAQKDDTLQLEGAAGGGAKDSEDMTATEQEELGNDLLQAVLNSNQPHKQFGMESTDIRNSIKELKTRKSKLSALTTGRNVHGQGRRPDQGMGRPSSETLCALRQEVRQQTRKTVQLLRAWENSQAVEAGDSQGLEFSSNGSTVASRMLSDRRVPEKIRRLELSGNYSMASELSSMSFQYAMNDTAFTDDSVESDARVDLTWQADKVDDFDGDYSYGDTAERNYAEPSSLYSAGPESDESDGQQEDGQDSQQSFSGRDQDQDDDQSPSLNLNVTAAVAKRLTPAERAKLTRQERKTPWQRALDGGLDLDELWLRSLTRPEKSYDLVPGKGWKDEIDSKIKQLTTTGTTFGGREFNPGNMDWLTYFINEIWNKGLSSTIQDKFHLNHTHVLESLKRYQVFPRNTVTAYEMRTRTIMQRKLPAERRSEFISGCEELGLKPMWERSPKVWKQVQINRTHISNPEFFGLIIQSAIQYYDTTPIFNEWEEKCHSQGVSRLFPRINIPHPEKFCGHDDGARELFVLIDQQKTLWRHAVSAAPIEKIYYSCWFLDSALLAKIKAQFGDQSWQSPSGGATADEADWVEFKEYVGDLHADLFQYNKGLCGLSSSATYVARLNTDRLRRLSSA